MSAVALSGLPPLGGGPLAAVAITLGATAVLTFLLGYWGGKEQLAPNAAFGIRTKRTLENERAWYHVHRSAAPWLTVSAGLLLAGAVAPFFIGAGAAQFTAIMAGCVLYVGVLCAGAIRAHRTIPSTTPE